MLHLATLGRIDLRRDDGSEVDALLAQPKRLALLVYLAAGATPRFHRRDSLVALFWPEADGERGRAALRKGLHFIRREAGDVLRQRGAEEVGVDPAMLVSDASRLEALAAAGDHEQALALYHGDFLAGFFVRGAPDLDDWAERERVRLRRRAVDSAWALADRRATHGDLPGAVAAADRAVALAPLDEPGVRRLLLLLERAGDRPRALAAYDAFAQRLAAQLEVEPDAESRALAARLATRDATPAVARPAVPPVAVPPVAVPPVAVPSSAPVATPGPAPVPVPQRPAVVPPAAQRRWRGWVVATVGAAAVLVALVRQATLARGADGDAGGVTRVAVLPFEVRGPAAVRYLRDGLPLLLATRLDGAGALRAVDQRALLLALDADEHDPARGRATAARLGARLRVEGWVVGQPDSLHVDIVVRDVARGDSVVARAGADGTERELVPLVERLAAALLAERLRADGDALDETAARTTASFAALKAWLRGEQAMTAGRYDEAVAAFGEAVARDSTFAIAHLRLAQAATWTQRHQERIIPEARAAVAHADRLPASMRTLTHAFLAYRVGEYADAERLYREALADRPTAAERWNDLAEILFHANPARGRPLADARVPFETVLRLDPAHFPATLHLARLAAARGDLATLDTLTDRALAIVPDSAHALELRLLRLVALRDRRGHAAVQTAVDERGLLDALWRSAEYTGALGAADSLAEGLIAAAQRDETRASLALFRAHIAMGRARWSEAQAAIDALAAVAPRSAARTRVLLALHPALPAASRDRLVARARAAMDSLDGMRSSVLFTGVWTPDSTTGADDALRALLAPAAGPVDSAPARPASRLIVPLLAAGDAASRAVAIRAVARTDSAYANRPSDPQPWVPRAWVHLQAARTLAALGRIDEARGRLDASPEDLGFGVAYLASLRQLRSELAAR